ncbi:putative phosphoenolpyruvate synthase-like [Tropilaelaps mercedesae]|uniref:Putative phosphoenolpyruvate synthase-like n=1 Tax=Tropilaelaps mercedesae TaxID=418985 RepID=A0A1V9XY71_9ACAR|nr:putative phosphoenolpyruvate synthase-like [Tropilaelaps mercedesae]
MTPEEALEWLKTSESDGAKRFRNFLEMHGHRCVKELDVFTEPWAMSPIKLVKTLLIAASVPHDPKPPQSSAYDLDRLTNIELNFIQKLLLEFFIPRARRAIINREVVKSAAIQVIHKLRLAINRLADLMVSEGRLPHRELLFFLTFDEIRRLIATRSSTILTRAIRRHRLHPLLDAERFPILQVGFPHKIEPMKFNMALPELKGTPVCKGIVEGPARVITHFEDEAHLIGKGDILITTATDTAWTPLFQILGGVVTEAEGLVSHGAVLAREHGLPCVVGVDNCTQMFRSGDLLRLDGGKGTVQKIRQRHRRASVLANRQ